MTQKPITFEQFKAAIDAIIAHEAEIDAFTKAISPAFDDQFIFCTLGQKSTRALIDVLQQVLDAGEWIEWFIYECDAGKKPMGYTVDGKEYMMDSVEKLWEVICA